jgi:hypothetical protein
VSMGRNCGHIQCEDQGKKNSRAGRAGSFLRYIEATAKLHTLTLGMCSVLQATFRGFSQR